jgi:Trk-type K+ transport system membrane component
LPSRNNPKPAPPSAALAPLLPNPIGGGFGRDLSNALFPAFLGLVLLGFFFIWKFGSAAGNPNPVRALFISMNCATLSGFNENPGVGGLNPFGQSVALALIIAGSLFTMIVGGLAVIRIVRMKFTDRELITAAFIVEAVALILGTSLLWDADRSPFQALFLSASAFGNCGLYVANVPGASNLPVHAVILPLTVLGGLGLPVLMELFDALIFHAKLSDHSKYAISITAWLYILGLVLIVALNQANRGPLAWSTLKSQLPFGSVLSLESRTGGLPIASASDLTQPARWIVIVLMFIGASPAGTGSGLKTTTLAALASGTRKLLRGEHPGRTFTIAFVWLLVYLALAFGAVLLLSFVSAAASPDNVLFDAVSALGNVGLTTGNVLDEKGLFFAYSAIILVGRMSPLMVLWWMAESTNDATVAVG